MAAQTRANSDPLGILVPILATQLVSVFQRQLRELARSLERKRGQPPKRTLAAAKVLYQSHPDEARSASRSLNGNDGAQRGRTRAGGGSTAPADDAASALDLDALDLDEVEAEPIAEAIEALEEWLVEGRWAHQPDDEPPALLDLIERTVNDLEGATARPVTAMIADCRSVVVWATTFLEQRPRDAEPRDELVLLTTARLRVVHQEGSDQRPSRANTLLSQPTDRLDIDWANNDAPGVATYSKGHFGNDQAQFNEACRALVIDLLQRAGDKGAGRTVYVATNIFEHAPGGLKAELDQKIRDCLSAGWTVVHVLGRADGSGDITPQIQVDFATHVLSDMETRGIYVPVLVSGSDRNDRTDMVLAEGVGALVFPSIGFSSANSTPPSPAMAVRCITGRGGRGDGPAATPIVGELRAEARSLYADNHDRSRYLNKRRLDFGFRVPTENLRWFDRQLTASELLEGDRYALKSWLPTSTLPNELSDLQFERWKQQLDLLRRGEPDLDGLVRGWSERSLERARSHLESTGWDTVTQWLDRLRHKRAMRHFGFETNVDEYRYRDCILRSRIVRYLSEEDPWFSANPIYGPAGLTLDQRQEHGLYLAQMLERTRISDEMMVGSTARTGYGLGLVADEGGQPYDLVKTWWLATRSTDHRADQVHYIHARDRQGPAWVATLKQESVIDFKAVQTFMAVFDGIWYSIELHDRMPVPVRDFILDQLPAPVRSRFKPLGADGTAR